MQHAQRLISLPPAMAARFGSCESRPEPDWVASSDPSGPLGSAGGTVHLLAEAWRRTGEGRSFSSWLQASRKLVIHSGGMSRRLPGYAAVGKALMPIPVLRGSIGQRPDQELVDLLTPSWDRLLEAAPSTVRVAVTSGDALVRFTEMPSAMPEVDVLCIGIDGTPEDAQHFGVFFATHQEPSTLDFFLQKPGPEEVRRLASTHSFLLDTGVWLLSERAVDWLMRRCGWDETSSDFGEGGPAAYELYQQFGLTLGAHPTLPGREPHGLTCAVVPAQGSFHHFGTTRQLIEAVTRLHNQTIQRNALGFVTLARRHPDQHLQNAVFAEPHAFAPGQRVWVENSHIGAGWKLDGDNVVTGVPDNDWGLQLPHGRCLDVMPVRGGWCIRPYGFDDPFRGPVGDGSTLFLGAPLAEWLGRRGLTCELLGVPEDADLADASLFPVIGAVGGQGRFISWLVAENPPSNDSLREQYLHSQRLSANALLTECEPERLYAQRRGNLVASLQSMLERHTVNVFYTLDLEATAELLAATSMPELSEEPAGEAPLIKRMHHSMFRAAWRKARGDSDWETDAARAFARLRECLTERGQVPAAFGTCKVQEDQIVWGRAPLRLDLAGGWSDTPPYCLLNGGKVLNVAVDLNGQPPVQVFARLCDRPEFVLRSIDLGTETRVRTFEELRGVGEATSEFALAKIALGLAGFDPAYRADGAFRTLADQLEEFGGGIELSLLAAVPKGSGLGTSSILAATVLAVLSDLCGLGWTPHDVFQRTMALEQLLGTGGGWQDQTGGCFHGIKVCQTPPGLEQRPTSHWLPERILGGLQANQTALLYYTGITRMARSVLGEIVRGMFLNSGHRLQVLREIVDHVDPLAGAIQREDWDAFGLGIRRSWELNQALDSGTNPPPVVALLAEVEDYLLGAKLLGAGGGGYLLMVAKDEVAAARVRQALDGQRFSPKARFVNFGVSSVGLEVTRS